MDQRVHVRVPAAVVLSKPPRARNNDRGGLRFRTLPRPVHANTIGISILCTAVQPAIVLRSGRRLGAFGRMKLSKWTARAHTDGPARCGDRRASLVGVGVPPVSAAFVSARSCDLQGGLGSRAETGFSLRFSAAITVGEGNCIGSRKVPRRSRPVSCYYNFKRLLCVLRGVCMHAPFVVLVCFPAFPRDNDKWC